MSFFKKYPSLKGKETAGANLNGRYTFYFWDDVIEEYTLDKQRVKEAIMRLPNDNHRYILLKELGLVD